MSFENLPFLARLYDAVAGGRPLHEGVTPLPMFADLDEEARREAAAWLLPVVRATLRLLVTTPVEDALLDAASAPWLVRRVEAFLLEQVGEEG